MARKRRPKAKIKTAFQAGRYTATEAQWYAALCTLAGLGYDRIAVTEAGTKAARRAIARFAKDRGFGVNHPEGFGRDECAILHREAVLSLASADVELLTDLRLRYGRTAPLYATVGRYAHKKHGYEDCEKVTHAPAHLDEAWPALVHAAATGGLRGGPRTTFKMDLNLDVRLERNRDWAEDRWPGMRLAKGMARLRGTFHRRVIDVMFFGARVKQFGKVKRIRRTPFPGFDHCPIGATIDMRPLAGVHRA